MKIYISGKISGLPTEIAEDNFHRSEELLTAIGFETVNPMREIAKEHREWIDYICDDLRLLNDCDAIYLQSNWTESQGANIERAFAKAKGIRIFYATSKDEFCRICKIKSAIERVVNNLPTDWLTVGRKSLVVIARTIMCYEMIRSRIPQVTILEYLQRGRTMVDYYVDKYEWGIKLDASFRETANKIKELIDSENGIELE